jgi:PTS system ascorbate-specific IIB component
MAKYRIAVCCTFGAGSSLMLKMNLDSVFTRMGVDADVEVQDISSISGVVDELDAIYTSTALIQQIEDVVKGKKAVTVPVVNYFDLDELENLTKTNLLQE